MYLIDKIERGEYRLEIHQDIDPENPCNWGHPTQMIFFGKYKHIGNKHDYDLGGFEDRDDFMERGAEKLSKLMDAAIIKPVHIYSHSGECISTSLEYPFNDRFDSGTIGFAVITKKDLKEGFSTKRLTKSIMEKGEKMLEGDVKVLDVWVRGEICGFKLFKNNEEINSCWGFYGYDYKTNGISDHLPEDWVD